MIMNDFQRYVDTRGELAATNAILEMMIEAFKNSEMNTTRKSVTYKMAIEKFEENRKFLGKV